MRIHPHSSLDLAMAGALLFFLAVLFGTIGFCSHYIFRTILQF